MAGIRPRLASTVESGGLGADVRDPSTYPVLERSTERQLLFNTLVDDLREVSNSHGQECPRGPRTRQTVER